MKEVDAKRLEDEINKARNGVQARAEKSVHHAKAWKLHLIRRHCLKLSANTVAEAREILVMWALLPDLEEVA